MQKTMEDETETGASRKITQEKFRGLGGYDLNKGESSGNEYWNDMKTRCRA